MLSLSPLSSLVELECFKQVKINFSYLCISHLISKNVECRKRYQLNIKIMSVAFFRKIPALINFQAFFAKILALFSAVSKLNNEISWKICQKMRNTWEICSRKWFRNRKSKVAEYSKILADLPSEQIFTEITRWVPLISFGTWEFRRLNWA